MPWSGAGGGSGVTLADVKADAIANPGDYGLGSSAALDVGTGVGEVVQMAAGPKLPAVDGSDLTGIAAGDTVTAHHLRLNGADQTVSDGDDVTFDTQEPSGELTIAGAVITIPSGSKALLVAALGVGNGTNDWLDYQWYDNTNITYIGNRGHTTAPTASNTTRASRSLTVGVADGDKVVTQTRGGCSRGG